MKQLKICFFILILLPFAVKAQNTNILQGKVLNANKKPLEKVNIVIKDSKLGTFTDKNGKFQLSTRHNTIDVLVSNVGFEPQEISVNLLRNKTTVITIILNSKTYELQEVVINSNRSLVPSSITKAKERQKMIAGATNVVSMRGLESQRSLTLKDALQMQPGVIIQEFFGSNDQPRLNIRGSGIQSNPQRRGINLLQDGATTNFADGSYIIGVLEPRAANYIEVFKGANGLKYGATTLGGAINLVSKNGYTASSPLEIKLEGGSFEYKGGSVSSGFVSGKTDGYASVSYNDAKGFRDFNTSSRINATFNIGQKVSDNFETRLYATYTKLEFDITGPLTQDQMDTDRTQINFGVKKPKYMGPNVLRDKPRRISEIIRIANKNVYKFNDNNTLTLDVHYQYGDDDFIFPVSDGIRKTISNDVGSSITFNNKSLKNNFFVGINAGVGYMNRAFYVNMKGEKGKMFTDDHLTAKNFVFFAEDIYKFTSKLSGVLSVQTSFNIRENNDVFSVPMRPFFNFATKSYGNFPTQNTSFSKDYFGFNPKLGVIYAIKNNQQIFANVSRSYEPPTFDELFSFAGGNPNKSPSKISIPDLKEQTATTFEIGSRGTYKRVHWDVSFYHAMVKNEILTTTDFFGARGSTRNSPDQTIHQGVELGLGATIVKNIFGKNNDKIDFNSVYNFSNFYFNEGIYKDNQIAGIPKHYVTASLTYKNPNGIFVDFNTEWLPEKSPTDHRNTLYQKAYQLFGVKVGYNKSKWGVYVEGKNITDVNYASSYLIRDVVPSKIVTTFIPGQGINFVGGVYYRL